jgi:uncharacterized protein YndB with AHSA1/START domain
MSTATATKPSLTIKRRLKASPAKVFAAWTDPQKIARWFGPPGVTGVEAQSDLSIGGRWRIVGHSANDTHEVSGVYREIVPDQKLVYTWAWKSTPERESIVTVTFKPDGDGTLLTLLQEQFFDEAARDRHSQGWNGALDKLEAYIAS